MELRAVKRREALVTGQGIGAVTARNHSGASLAMRMMLSISVAAILLYVLRQRLASVAIVDVAAAFSSLAPAQWMAAIIATIISFWAVGQYDVALHRHLRTGLAGHAAARAGITAIAMSQTLGMGLLSGALIRWRMLPGYSIWHASRLTLVVTLSFMAGWAVVTALVLLISPAAPFKLLAALGLGFAGVLAVFCLLQGEIIWRGQTIRLPNALTLGRILALTALDTAAAALALYVLVPPEVALPFSALLPAYLLALGAGMISGTPGGVGAFEVTLFALMPGVEQAPVMAAILAFRAIYYAAPALIAAVVAAFGPAHMARQTGLRWPADPELAALAPRAESLLLRQGALTVKETPTAAFMVGRSAHFLIALFDPLDQSSPNPFPELRRAAKDEARLPCLYKANARNAVLARRAGYAVLPIAREAVLSPAHFTLDIPACAGLRRKLRKAEKAGVTLQCARRLPLGAMRELAQNWAEAHGGERGFSMGRFCPRYLQGQRVYLAYLGDHLLGFVSFHLGATEWTLDLMRHRAETPDGTMQALIALALRDARALNVTRLSLAAVPEAAFQTKGTLRGRLARLSKAEGTGLLQFKAAFAPKWRPLYLATPARHHLPLAGAEIARAILRPREIATTAPPAPIYARDLSL